MYVVVVVIVTVVSSQHLPTCIYKFQPPYVLLTVHLGIILVNNQLYAQLFIRIFLILYVFQAAMCSSSGESIVSIRHLVYVTLCR